MDEASDFRYLWESTFLKCHNEMNYCTSNLENQIAYFLYFYGSSLSPKVCVVLIHWNISFTIYILLILKHDANIFKFIRSKIGLKIGILVAIQIVFIISSFSILSYYESQGTYLGNSINIAGKNRFLTSRSNLFQIILYPDTSTSYSVGFQ